MKIGVIGCGSIGARHIRNLLNMGHTVFCYDPHNSSVIDGREIGVQSLSALLGETNKIVIASPTLNHEEHLAYAILCGAHVLIEKPIGASNADSIRDSLKQAKDKGLVVYVGYNGRVHACVKQAKQWLTEGKIGNPIWASVTLAQYSEKKPYLRDGVVTNWSHELDLALYLLGPAKVAAASIGTQDYLRLSELNKIEGIEDLKERAEVLADIILLHESGARSTCHLDYLTRPEIRATTIIGDAGQIAIDLVNNTACFVDLEGKREDLQFQQDWSQTYIDEMKAFLDRIDGKETLGATGEEGLQVLEVCLEARRLAGILT